MMLGMPPKMMEIVMIPKMSIAKGERINLMRKGTKF